MNAPQTIDLEGAVNLRDLGGYSGADGRRVQPGLLYRSGTLTHLSSSAQRQFAGLNVKLICDLRRDDEKQEEPTPFPEHAPRRLEIPIDPGSAVELRTRLARTGLELADRIRYMTDLTAELVRDHVEDYVKMFDGLLNLEEGGFLVHCSAGKDRTGVAVALILHALGVPKETVVQDYLFTNQCIDYEGYILPKWLERFEPQQVPAKDAVMALAGVRPEYLQAAYDAIESEFDSAEHYIVEAMGFEQDALAELRARYLG